MSAASGPSGHYDPYHPPASPGPPPHKKKKKASPRAPESKGVYLIPNDLYQA